MVHSAKVYCTPPSQMGKSVQANLSRGLQSLTGYRQVGAVGEVASAVVAVADTASDTVGVGDSALSEMSMFISLSGSVWCATGGCFGAQSFKWSTWCFQNWPFPTSTKYVSSPSDWMISPGTESGPEQKFFTITDWKFVEWCAGHNALSVKIVAG